MLAYSKMLDDHEKIMEVLIHFPVYSFGTTLARSQEKKNK